MENFINRETNRGWLELGFAYCEALFERGEMDELSFEAACEDYKKRGV